MKLGLCQLPVTADLRQNHAAMQDMVRKASAQGCDVICLPEMWPCPYENSAFVAFADSDSAAGTTVSGLVGSAIVAALAVLICFIGGFFRKKNGQKR